MSLIVSSLAKCKKKSTIVTEKDDTFIAMLWIPLLELEEERTKENLVLPPPLTYRVHKTFTILERPVVPWYTKYNPKVIHIT